MRRILQTLLLFVVVVTSFVALSKFDQIGSVSAQSSTSVIPKSECDYFVAPNGSDGNSGSESSPFKTITKGGQAVGSGQALCIKGGTYKEIVNIRDKQGSQASPIKIGEYMGGGEVTVTGDKYSFPDPNCRAEILACRELHPQQCGIGCQYNNLFSISGVNYLNLYGIEVKEASGLGVGLVESQNVLVKDMYIHSNYVSGFNVKSVKDSTLEGITIFDNVRYMAETNLQGGAGMQVHSSNNIHLRKVAIIRNFGEGLNLGKNSDNIIVENSLFYENGHTALYANHTTNTIFNANFHVCTGKKPEWLCANGRCTPDDEDTYGTALTFREESNPNKWDPSHNNSVINSIFIGCTNHIVVGTQEGLVFNPILVANNTFVEANSPGGQIPGTILRVQSDLNQPGGKSLFVNNIIVQKNDDPAIITDNGNNFSYISNISNRATGKGGITIADPKLAKAFDTSAIDELFEAKPQDYIITSGSPAIDKGTMPPFANFNVGNRSGFDFFANTRPLGSQSDIGAYEFGGGTNWDWIIPPDFCDEAGCGGNNNTKPKTLTWDYTLQDLIRIYEDRDLDKIQRNTWRGVDPVQQPLGDPQMIYCKNGQPSAEPEVGDERLYTAIGCIPIGSASAFTIYILGWVLSLGGGLTFLLIIFATYKIMTSNGDPKKLQAGKELLTACISGLFLIIFSVFILRVIGSGILQIPGL